MGVVDFQNILFYFHKQIFHSENKHLLKQPSQG